MIPDELKHRTRTFAIEVIKLAKALPTDFVTAHIARQLMRSGTSVGTNYRSSCRAKSAADFISKMATVEEEADEGAEALNARGLRSVDALVEPRLRWSSRSVRLDRGGCHALPRVIPFRHATRGRNDRSTHDSGTVGGPRGR